MHAYLFAQYRFHRAILGRAAISCLVFCSCFFPLLQSTLPVLSFSKFFLPGLFRFVIMAESLRNQLTFGNEDEMFTYIAHMFTSYLFLFSGVYNSFK